jgi:DNA-binding IclR family transcriptional regulator
MIHDCCAAAVVGEVARALLLARVFWGTRSKVPVKELSEMVAVAETTLRRVLYVFYRRKWIWYDDELGLVGLTEVGVAALAGRTGVPQELLDQGCAR